jgi:hypothetical protein
MTSELGVGTTLVRLVERVAKVTVSILKLFSRWVSDRVSNSS